MIVSDEDRTFLFARIERYNALRVEDIVEHDAEVFVYFDRRSVFEICLLEKAHAFTRSKVRLIEAFSLCYTLVELSPDLFFLVTHRDVRKE